MHIEEAGELLEELIEDLGGDYTLQDMRREGGNKRGAHVGHLLTTAEALLVGDCQELASRFARAACAAMEVLELEHGDGE